MVPQVQYVVIFFFKSHLNHSEWFSENEIEMKYQKVDYTLGRGKILFTIPLQNITQLKIRKYNEPTECGLRL